MTLKSMALAAGTVMSLVLSSSAWTADVQTMAVDAAKNQAVETAKDQATGTVKGHANRCCPRPVLSRHRVRSMPRNRLRMLLAGKREVRLGWFPVIPQ